MKAKKCNNKKQQIENNKKTNCVDVNTESEKIKHKEYKKEYECATRNWYENPHKIQSFLPLHMGTGAWNIDFGNKGAGTLGCIVKRKVNNDYNYYILSAGHVFGNVFNTSPFPTGHRIVHPALLDKKYNKESNIVGKVKCWKQIINNRLYKGNKIDAGLAKVYRYTPNLDRLVSGEILGIGSIYDHFRDHNLHLLGREVIKSGRTTRVTSGVVVGIGHVVVWYDNERYAIMLNQLIIIGTEGPFSLPGDSGSVVVTKDEMGRNIACGLVYAGNDYLTIACPMRSIVKEFGIEFNIDEITKCKHTNSSCKINTIYNKDKIGFGNMAKNISSAAEKVLGNGVNIMAVQNIEDKPCITVYGEDVNKDIVYEGLGNSTIIKNSTKIKAL